MGNPTLINSNPFHIMAFTLSFGVVASSGKRPMRKRHFLETSRSLSSEGSSSSAWASKPNILYILADDWGWADAGWHRDEGYAELQTPNMNALVKSGVELDRHYVYALCSPTRAAIQSGRNPVHVNVLNDVPESWNPNDPQGGSSGIPRDMTGIAEKMRHGGYATYMYGKWDAGMATPYHTPYGRGYDRSLVYFGHGNGFWNHQGHFCDLKHIHLKDLWEDKGPGKQYANPIHCSQENQSGCVYEDRLFTRKVSDAIEQHASDETKPFFIFWAPHIVHTPLEVPDDYLARFAFIDHPIRRIGHAMINFLDDAIGEIVTLLKRKQLWDNTFLVMHADNGGSLWDAAFEAGGHGAANNYPLKGSKGTNWEGGIRVNAFVSGGFLPTSVRGTKQEGLMAGWDWYATFAHLAGVDHIDSRAKKMGLPSQDTHNLWPLICGTAAISPRSELAIGKMVGRGTSVGGLISGRYKILLGENKAATWTGPTYPETDNSLSPNAFSEHCGKHPNDGCLYDIYSDPEERLNIAAKEPNVFHDLLGRIEEITKTVYEPERGEQGPEMCEKSVDNHGGYMGPFHSLDEETWIDAATRYQKEVSG